MSDEPKKQEHDNEEGTSEPSNESSKNGQTVLFYWTETAILLVEFSTKNSVNEAENHVVSVDFE